MSLFRLPELFEEAEVTIYGESKTVSYYCANLLWKPIEDMIRFVWVMDGENTYILMCSDLKLSPTEIITIYSYRWKSRRKAELIKRGINPELAHTTAFSAKGPWRISHTPDVRLALNNQFFDRMGLIRLSPHHRI